MSIRRCPRCTFTLVPHRPPAAVAGGPSAEVDVCPRCHGTWLDAGDAKHMLGENAEPETWERTTAAKFGGKGKLGCPSGHGALSMYKLQAPPGSGVEVEVDVCPVCMGMWLDAWEAARISQSTQKLVADTSAIPLQERKTGAGWYLFMLFSFLPVEEYNPVRKKRVVVLALIAACAAVYALEISVRDQIAFLLTYGMVPKDVMNGVNVHSLVTHIFMHASVAHLLGNMWMLYTFGDNIEDRVGRVRFTFLFLLFGAMGGLLQLGLTLGSDVPLVGASGAIAGLFGAYVVLFPKVKLFTVLAFIRFKVPAWIYFGLWMLMNVVLGYVSLQKPGEAAGVAWWAHIGGFVAGALWGALARKKYGDGAELRSTSASGAS